VYVEIPISEWSTVPSHIVRREAGRRPPPALPRDPHLLEANGITIFGDAGGAELADALAPEHSARTHRGRVAAQLLPIGKPGAGAPGSESALLVLAAPNTGEAALQVTVNGFPALPANVVDVGDEIGVTGTRFVLRADEAPGVHPFDGTGHAMCTLCKRPLFRGDAVIACGHCGGPHHEGPRADRTQSPLWCHRYAPLCSRCGGELAAPAEAAATMGTGRAPAGTREVTVR
jgi:hypothetical protein